MIQRPFYPEGRKVCQACVLHPPGGVVGGDRLHLQLSGVNDAEALITTPGATKYYGSDGREASQHQVINLQDAALEWMPQESIYFDGCRATQSLQINLSHKSRFIGWDISCFGRPAGDHVFVDGRVRTRLSVYSDGQPLLHEQLRIDGSDDLRRVSGMRGAVVVGTLLAFVPDMPEDELVDLLRASLPEDACFAATQFDDLMIVRYLGTSAEHARDGFIAAWRVLRPIAIGREVVVPRIWAT